MTARHFVAVAVLIYLQSHSAHIHLTYACGRELHQLNTVQQSADVSDDIAMRMKRRAHYGYGIQVNDPAFLSLNS